MSNRVVTLDDLRDAAASLRALLPSGRLHFVTSLHRCVDPPGLVTSTAAQLECWRWARAHDDGIYTRNLLADPRHFVCVPIARFDGPNINGVMIAHTARGDRCTGLATALMSRLLKYDTVMRESRARLANIERDKGVIAGLAPATAGARA